ncbi:MAG: hypothetical protein N4A72_16790 [Bacteroidales bacterium]|jgi:hypothetical protein|nr:hypothetical protein [Bacteroidales bacterium]
MRILGLLSIFLLTSFLGCVFGKITNYDDNKENKNKVSNKIVINDTDRTSLLNRTYSVLFDNDYDSIMFDYSLRDAYLVAKPKLHKKRFRKSYEISPDSGSYISIDLLAGDIFNDGSKYLLLNRSFEGADIHTDLFKIDGNKLECIISYKPEYYQDYFDYRYQIKDVNRDGKKDLIIYWLYSTCIDRDMCNVYLKIGDSSTFSEKHEFINPTFSFKEGVVRCYQHYSIDGGMLYKYIWNGLEPDPIEYIYIDFENKGQYIRSDKAFSDYNDVKGERLESLPREYKKGEYYKQFIKSGAY